MKRALVSTSNKEGLINFLEPLFKNGLEVISTGGTLDFLIKNKINAKDVSTVTNFPEVLDGRVKTLHPAIHMGLLADKRNSEHLAQLSQHQVKSFDLVIGNLYPFEQVALNASSTEEDLIENIDIGGPSFLRASAKNFHSVVVVCDPDDYSWVQKKLLDNEITNEDRKKLALKVFSLTSYYDALIVQKLCKDKEELKYLNFPLKKKQPLRYGENSHQSATWYENPLQISSLSSLVIHQGKELSYNNLLDLDAAIGLVQQLAKPACVAVKHNNPCGVAEAESLLNACKKTIQSDSKSIFGGIVAVNRPVDLKICETFKDIFLECLIAPQFDESSLQFLSTKKNLRVLSLKSLSTYTQTTLGYNLKTISGGALQQQQDHYTNTDWQFLSEKPNDDLYQSMRFGEKVAGFLKSNSIAIVYQEQTIGLGMGQVNRVDAVEQAVKRMNDYRKEQAVDMQQVVLVSDAFFPFPDSIELIAKTGIRWIVQPGGSNKDQLVFDEAKKQNINMILSKTRHFRH